MKKLRVFVLEEDYKKVMRYAVDNFIRDNNNMLSFKLALNEILKKEHK